MVHSGATFHAWSQQMRALLAVLALLAGCALEHRPITRDGGPDLGDVRADAPTDADVLVCGDGTAACNGQCVDITADPANCGGCGVACTGELRCIGGACVCPGGQVLCGGRCVDTRSDPANCGGCGQACSALQFCSSGRCTTTCTAPQTECMRACVNLDNDLLNCGACGNRCPDRANATTVCAGGRCGFMCQAGFADCNRMPGDGCEVDLRSSVANCGMCGRVCAVPNGTPACTGGTCTIGACIPGFADCDGMVENGCEADLTTVMNCGMCGRRCPLATQVHVTAPSCAMGMCAFGGCDAGWGDCNGVPDDGCETSLTTTANCGTCGVACAAGQACTGGACACPAGQTLCGGACTNTDTDPMNCGMCGRRCASGVCTGGMCLTCLPGETVCARRCVNTKTDPVNCGGCSRVCPGAAPHVASSVCAAGSCTITCTTGYANCDGLVDNGCEVNTTNNPSNCGSCRHTCPSGRRCVSGMCTM
jgi:hypothetical protein